MQVWIIVLVLPTFLLAFDIDLKPFASSPHKVSRKVNNADFKQMQNVALAKANSANDNSDEETNRLIQQYYWLANLIVPSYDDKITPVSNENRKKTKSFQRGNLSEDNSYNEIPSPREVQPPPL